MRHVTRKNGSCQTHGPVEPHIRMHHVIHKNESRHTYTNMSRHVQNNLAVLELKKGNIELARGAFREAHR